VDTSVVEMTYEEYETIHLIGIKNHTQKWCAEKWQTVLSTAINLLSTAEIIKFVSIEKAAVGAIVTIALAKGIACAHAKNRRKK